MPPGPDPYRFSQPGEMMALLRGAGLVDPRVATVAFAQPVAGVESLWQGLLGGSVRSAARVAAQPEAGRHRARQALERLAAGYRDGERLAVPVSVTLGSAHRG